MQQLFAPINGCLGHHASPGTHRRRMAHKLAYLNDTAPQIGLATFFPCWSSRFKRATFIPLITFFFCPSENARLQTLMSSESKKKKVLGNNRKNCEKVGFSRSREHACVNGAGSTDSCGISTGVSGLVPGTFGNSGVPNI